MIEKALNLHPVWFLRGVGLYRCGRIRGSSSMTNARGIATCPTPETPYARNDSGRQCRPEQVLLGALRLGSGVLQLLQRANLDLHRSRLSGEPLLFLGERVDALALGLGRHVDGG